MKNKFTILLVFICQLVYGQIIKGKVVDYNSSEGVAFAEIYCLETLNGVIADSTGYWELDNIINNQMTLKISASDYDGKIIKVDKDNEDIIIRLNLAHIHLDEVIISTSDSKLQRYSIFPVESRKIADLNKIEQTNLIDAMSNILDPQFLNWKWNCKTCNKGTIRHESSHISKWFKIRKSTVGC